MPVTTAPPDKVRDPWMERVNRAYLAILLTAAAGMSLYAYLHPGDPAPPDPLPENWELGLHVWRKNNCQTCHQIYGLGGYMGPDLTNVFLPRRGSRSYVEGIVKHGSIPMPRLGLTDEEVQAVATFLEHTGRTGRWPMSEPTKDKTPQD